MEQIMNICSDLCKIICCNANSSNDDGPIGEKPKNEPEGPQNPSPIVPPDTKPRNPSPTKPPDTKPVGPTPQNPSPTPVGPPDPADNEPLRGRQLNDQVEWFMLKLRADVRSKTGDTYLCVRDGAVHLDGKQEDTNTTFTMEQWYNPELDVYRLTCDGYLLYRNSNSELLARRLEEADKDNSNLNTNHLTIFSLVPHPSNNRTRYKHLYPKHPTQGADNVIKISTMVDNEDLIDSDNYKDNNIYFEFEILPE